MGDPQAAEVRTIIEEMVTQFRAMDGGAVGAEAVEQVRRAVDLAGSDRTSRAMGHAQVAGVLMQQYESGRSPVGALDDVAREFRLATDAARDEDPRQVFYLSGWAGALVQRYDRLRRPEDLATAMGVLERARTLAGDAAHPQWALLCSMHAQAHRLAGRPDVAARIGRDGLRGHTWSVLLQSDPGAAADVARDAAADAIREARWSLGYGHNEAAVAALEAGRGLALQAATRFRDAEEQLRERGATGLADRWRQAVAGDGADGAPVDLRREVVAALDGPGPGRGSAAPDVEEIQSALLRLDTDALVYLVAGIPEPESGNREGGFALVVPGRGRCTLHLLPELITQPGDALDQWRTASWGRSAALLGGRAVGTPPRSGPAEWEGSLERVCEWAWSTVMGPLLDEHLPREHSFIGGRTPRLAIVAMGELGQVPWHAARRRTGSGWIHALERAVLSTAVSARMVCDSATASDVALTSSGLIIGDPDTGVPHDGQPATDLPQARREAIEIRRHFYRDSRYLGRRQKGEAWPGSTGTRAEVQAWLDDPHGGPLLHAACHGIVRHDRSRANSSCLLLADGDEFAAEDLLGSLSASGPQRDLALVVLGACHTGVSGRGYDEALSLATAFLAGGVRTVVSAQWAVPDSATSALMFLFHHHLRRGGLGPVDALRAAQLWMLRPDSAPPSSMPRALRDAVEHLRPARVAAWAGFAHSGR